MLCESDSFVGYIKNKFVDYTCKSLVKPKSYLSLAIGASSGIGTAIAQLFSKCGASLTISGRSFESLQEVSRKCKEMSPTNLMVLSIYNS